MHFLQFLILPLMAARLHVSTASQPLRAYVATKIFPMDSCEKREKRHYSTTIIIIINALQCNKHNNT